MLRLELLDDRPDRLVDERSPEVVVPAHRLEVFTIGSAGARRDAPR